MVKKTETNLKVVDRSHEERQKRDEIAAPWEKAAKDWRIPADELRQRVRALRGELESYQREMEGVPFDITSDSPPYSLDCSERKYTVQLVEDLDTRVSSLFEMIDSFARDHGCHEYVDFNAKLFALKENAVETGFRIGVLAGVIFGGCPKEKIDAYERGMVVSLTSQGGLVKTRG